MILRFINLSCRNLLVLRRFFYLDTSENRFAQDLLCILLCHIQGFALARFDRCYKFNIIINRFNFSICLAKDTFMVDTLASPLPYHWIWYPVEIDFMLYKFPREFFDKCSWFLLFNRKRVKDSLCFFLLVKFYFVCSV